MFASTQDFIMISVINKHYAGNSLLSCDLITIKENPEVLFLFPSFRRTLQILVYLLGEKKLPGDKGNWLDIEKVWNKLWLLFCYLGLFGLLCTYSLFLHNHS